MKKIFPVILFLFLFFNTSAQLHEQTCHFGITFEISTNPNWGYGEPVVLTVEPNSPAEIAGIRPGDIIMEINGTATYLRNYQTIASWLFDENALKATFTIRNLNTYFKDYELPRRCRSIKAMDEAALASSFSMYSVENTQEREFTLPLTIATNPKIDYSDYHTFDFLEDPNAPAIDDYINTQLEKALIEKGLIRDNDSPDILIQTYYSYQPNPKFNPTNRAKKEVLLTCWRYDTEAQKMVLLPFLPVSNTNAENEGQFILELGIRFFEQKYVDTQNMTLIWEAKAKEFLSSPYTLEQYSRFHMPLIVMQFPYSADKETCRYVAGFKRYNYTGLCFSIDDMRTIADVDVNSPAYNAGLRRGMVIDKIDKESFAYSRNEILNGYKRFIVETMKYRDPKTRFTDANGFPDCMYWNRKDYKQVSKAFKKNIYVPVFRYLYNFEKYIADKPERLLMIETKVKKYNVLPEIKTEVTLRAF